MKRKTAIPIIAVLLTICGFIIKSSFAAEVVPGGAGDPLVSKSYVDEKIAQITNMINSLSTNGQAPGTNSSSGGSILNTADIAAQVVTQLEYLYGLTPNTDSTADNTIATVYEPVFVFAGQHLIGGEGAEIILRSGSATAYCPGDNGLVNITTGNELFNGMEITANNLILSPRDDGRGILAVTDAWFMVRGMYYVMN